MDVPITPYTRKAYLDPQGTFEVTLRWYPAPREAGFFPGYHKFSSGDFAEQDPHYAWPPPGERKDRPRLFYPGLGPQPTYLAANPAGSNPPCFTGLPEWYQNGVPLDVILSAMADPPGPPACLTRGPSSTSGIHWMGSFGDEACGCKAAGQPPIVVSGGAALGGKAFTCKVGPAAGRTSGGVHLGGSAFTCTESTAVQHSTGGVRVGTAGVFATGVVIPVLSRGGVDVGGAGFAFGTLVPVLSRGGVDVGGGGVEEACCTLYASSGGVNLDGDSTFSCYEHPSAALSRGGVQLGKTAVAIQTSGCTPAGCCGCDTYPNQWLKPAFTMSGPGPCFIFGTQFLLTLNGPSCHWIAGPYAGLLCDGVKYILSFGSPGVGSAQYTLPVSAWLCNGPNTMTYLADDGVCHGWPATITLTKFS